MAPSIRKWLAPAEQRLLAGHQEWDRAKVTNLVWTAKEAAAKVRCEGLRLDVRHAVVAPTDAGASDGAWRAVRVDWADGVAPTSGWWRAGGGWGMSIAGEPAPSRPMGAP